MSWLFSQALVAEYSADTCSAGEPSAQSNGNPTPQAYLSPDRMMAFSRLSRFGMTFAPLTADRGEELLTWYLAGFPVRTSRQPEPKRELEASDRDSGQKWLGSFARLSRDGCSWKTAQTSLLEDSETFSQIWPRWGSMRNGHVFQRATRVRHKPATGSGLLPTLVAGDARGGRNGTSKNRTPSDGMTMTDWVWANVGRGRLHPESAEWMMLWPQGWSGLEQLETARFRQWLRKHSPSCPQDSDKAAA